jgi:hypothetical protein
LLTSLASSLLALSLLALLPSVLVGLLPTAPLGALVLLLSALSLLASPASFLTSHSSRTALFLTTVRGIVIM